MIKPDTIRYVALEQPVYKRPEPEIDPDMARMIMANQNRESNHDSIMFHGLGMRS